MKSSYITRRIAAGMLATASAFAVAAPAQADPPQLNRAVQAQAASGAMPGDAVRPDDRADRPTAPLGQSAAVRPDDRAFRGLGTDSPASQVSSDYRADRNHPYTVAALPTNGDGFDWVDAGVGAAAGALGLVLLIAGAMVAGLRPRRTTALT